MSRLNQSLCGLLLRCINCLQYIFMKQIYDFSEIKIEKKIIKYVVLRKFSLTKGKVFGFYHGYRPYLLPFSILVDCNHTIITMGSNYPWATISGAVHGFSLPRLQSEGICLGTFSTFEKFKANFIQHKTLKYLFEREIAFCS